MHPRTKLLLKLIKERFFTKDNFWNLMFWVGITASLFLSDVIAQFSPNTGLFAVFVSLTVVPFLLARANKVTYTENSIFLNKQGQPLTDRLPTGFKTLFGFVFILSLCIIILFITGKSFLVIKLITAPLGIVTLYFLYKNCPISILFNKHGWTENVIGKGSNYVHCYNSNSNYYYNPMYKYLPSNLFYHNQKK